MVTMGIYGMIWVWLRLSQTQRYDMEMAFATVRSTFYAVIWIEEYGYGYLSVENHTR